ncbi:MAG: hypothetical protein ACXVII_36460 [Solirubrobacteraceae bacterium]
MGVEQPAVDIPHAQLRRDLDAARLAIVSLLAVVTDEQFRGVETALMSVASMSEPPRAALEELRAARERQRLAGEEDARPGESSRAV